MRVADRPQHDVKFSHLMRIFECKLAMFWALGRKLLALRRRRLLCRATVHTLIMCTWIVIKKARLPLKPLKPWIPYALLLKYSETRIQQYSLLDLWLESRLVTLHCTLQERSLTDFLAKSDPRKHLVRDSRFACLRATYIVPVKVRCRRSLIAQCPQPLWLTWCYLSCENMNSWSATTFGFVSSFSKLFFSSDSVVELWSNSCKLERRFQVETYREF